MAISENPASETASRGLSALLRDNGFLTRSRIRAWACLLLAGYMIAILYLAFTAHGLSDYQGRPLGTDFSNIYAAGVQAADGDAAAAFDIQRQYHEEQALFGVGTPAYGWHYPPFFLLVAAPLAHLPYIPALIVWQLGTLLLYLAGLRLLLRRSAPSLAADRLWVLVALGFSAVFVNLMHGHNGFLTAALFAAALGMLDARPLIAGMLLGLLCYKPQFAIVLPLILAVTGRWRTFLSAVVTVAVLAVLVTLLFGWAVWPAFLGGTHFTRTVVLEQGSTGFYKIQSIFAWVRMTGGSVSLAYGLQAAGDAAVIVALVRIWWSDASPAIKGAALCLGALLVTPYSLDYDLMLLAPAIALLAADAATARLRPWRGLLITALWIVPFAARPFAQAVGQPIAAPLMLLAMAVLYAQAMIAGAPVDNAMRDGNALQARA
jgi:alpha-1,2-mannosyltransferase